MQFRVGDRVLVSFAGYQDRITGIVVESDADSFLLFMQLFPRILDRLEFVRDATVEFVREGVLMGFNSEVMEFTTSPTSLVRLESPSVVKSHELRKDPRLPCCHPAVISVNGHSFGGIALDGSAKAFRVRLDGESAGTYQDVVEEGQDLEMSLYIFDEDEPRTLKGRAFRTFVKEHVVYAVVSIVDMDGQWQRSMDLALERVAGRDCLSRL